MNKRILLLILGISLSVSAILAETSSYFVENTRWGFLLLSETPGFAYKKDLCVLRGDTTIDSKLYQKIIYEGQDNGQRIIPIREEGKKIYAHVNSKDVLLYDFNLNVGDSKPNYVDIDGNIDKDQPELRVIKVDSITLLDGRRAKRIAYDNLFRDIEYVGSDCGLFAPFVYPQRTTGGYITMCCSLYGLPIYESGEGDCKTVHNYFDTFFAANTQWNYRVTDHFAQTTTKKSYTLKDSVVDGRMYQCMQGVLLRTEQAKVWCLVDSMDTQTEKLLYDFDLQVDDSIATVYKEYSPDNPNWFAKVTEVKTITLLDGRTARRISYDSRADDIEFVGSTLGLIAPANIPIAPNGIVEDFVCCTERDYVLYETAQGACDELVSSINNHASRSASDRKFLRVGQLFIKHNGKTYDVTGKEVK